MTERRKGHQSPTPGDGAVEMSSLLLYPETRAGCPGAIPVPLSVQAELRGTGVGL